MTLGAIKAEALRMMQVDIDVDENNVHIVEEDEGFRMYYSGIPGALNRAFSNLEARRVLPKKRAELTDARVLPGRVALFSLDKVPCFFAPARLVVIGEHYMNENCPFSYEAGYITVCQYDKDARYELLYYPAINRVTNLTLNSTGIDLPEQLAEALPYFIKAELYRMDEPGEANDARNWYEAAVEQYALSMTNGVQTKVESIWEETADEI